MGVRGSGRWRSGRGFLARRDVAICTSCRYSPSDAVIAWDERLDANADAASRLFPSGSGWVGLGEVVDLIKSTLVKPHWKVHGGAVEPHVCHLNGALAEAGSYLKRAPSPGKSEP